MNKNTVIYKKGSKPLSQFQNQDSMDRHYQTMLNVKEQILVQIYLLPKNTDTINSHKFYSFLILLWNIPFPFKIQFHLEQHTENPHQLKICCNLEMLFFMFLKPLHMQKKIHAPAGSHQVTVIFQKYFSLQICQFCKPWTTNSLHLSIKSYFRQRQEAIRIKWR